MTSENQLASRISRFRRHKNLSQRQFAKVLGGDICYSTICRLEQGHGTTYARGKYIEAFMEKEGEPVTCPKCNGSGLFIKDKLT